MIFIPVRTFKLRTDHSPAEVKRRLEKAFKPPPAEQVLLQAIRGEWIDGKIEGDRFAFSKGKWAVGDRNRMLAPAAYGRISAAGAGSEILVSVRPAKGVLYLVLALYAIVLFSLVTSILRHNNAGIIYPAAFLFLTFVILTPKYNRERDKYKALLESWLG
jgi:hypothetical protein